MTVSQLRGNLADVTNKVAYGGERVCLQRNQKPLLAMVPIADMELLESLEDLMDVQAAEEALKAGNFVSYESLKQELGL